ncbi:S-layer-like y domain-containing protein [Filibacter tadaridae]|uniref:Endo-beta-N-acetylglucosaminidase n=1 Tax=Filibacter tadaridae TaxID=2483811 RepID=A0A3P5WEZ3_9BACL|nr:S-layer homology domain-containing protein [Filibacter tadaridae]VDC19099.1 Putative endo-beta-N-acetylglucosaminidase precursor [Filibacter tadaridae]
MKRKLVAILTVILLTLPIVPMLTNADELTGLTLEKEMRAMIERGIIQGYGENDIRPKGEVTREQFAAFLARTLKLPLTESSFTDVNPSTELASSIGAIQVTGVMQGTTDNRFMPTKNITREEMALTMDRVIKYKKITVNQKEITFEDDGKFTLGGGLEAAKRLASIQVMSGGSSELGPDTFIFKPKAISTRDQVAAVLKRFIDFVEEYKGEVPDEEEKPTTPPVTDPNKFQLAIIENNSLVVQEKNYNTYTDAVQAFNASSTAQGIYQGKELLRVKSGMAFAQGPVGNNTIIYSSPSFGNQLTYLEAGREMRILEHAEKYIKVQVADTVGYVKQSQIDFVPTAISDNRDYYSVDTNQALLHNTYNYLSKSYGTYSIGPAPSFMKRGVRYYAADGVHFLDGAGKAVGTHHPYFQFQSIRTTTHYTAEQLDAYILTKLVEKESEKGIYKNASTKSKLIGLGTYMKQMETENHVNALFILSTAIHESNYGMSSKAQGINNLFGIGVFDSTPGGGKQYAKPENSVLAFVTQYANKNYGPPAGAYARGAVPGNKTAGFNVHYASDPTWGAKIAGHMWRIDQAMGSHDINTYRLAMTNQSGQLNVRTEPAVRPDTLLFTYKPRDLGRSGETGYPVAIIEQKVGSDGYNWYKVLSDDIKKDNTGKYIEFGWIRGDLVEDIN